MQIRRVLLLFGLVLGLSAVVASIAPAPEEAEEPPEPVPTAGPPAVRPADRAAPVMLSASGRGAPTRRVTVGSSFSLEVAVRKPGDVVIDDLGLRESAEPRAPARFDLLARPAGRYAVGFAPVRGEPHTIGWLAFVEPATVTPRPRGR